MLDKTTEMNTEVEIELTAGGLREALRRVRHACAARKLDITWTAFTCTTWPGLERCGSWRPTAIGLPRLILGRPKVPKPSARDLVASVRS